jgi:hypothetical protein
LDFSKILEMEIIALGGMKTPAKLQLDLSTGLKVRPFEFFLPQKYCLIQCGSFWRSF